MSATARRIVVRGRVQGVGFRYAMVRVARDAGVEGWVRNRRDGTVEAHVQGEVVAVERVVAWCRRGPPAAEVSAIESVDAVLERGASPFSTRATE